MNFKKLFTASTSRPVLIVALLATASVSPALAQDAKDGASTSSKGLDEIVVMTAPHLGVQLHD